MEGIKGFENARGPKQFPANFTYYLHNVAGSAGQALALDMLPCCVRKRFCWKGLLL
jgi:hypothetical protein